MAHLPVEACHQCDVSGGELYAACHHEQMLDTYKRLFETPRLASLRHVRCLAAAPCVRLDATRDGDGNPSEGHK